MNNQSNDAAYFATRLSPDIKRRRLWPVLYRYLFRFYIDDNDTVLDIGSGYGDFINTCHAKYRIAIDRWASAKSWLSPNVAFIEADVTKPLPLPDGVVNAVFASNLLEHLTTSDCATLVSEIHRVLTNSGRLIILQPNFRTAYRHYFDDYTHVSIWTDQSLCDLLRAHNFKISVVEPRQLPLTVKSRLPAWPLLVRVYLRSPIRPMSGQMLIVAVAEGTRND